MWTSVVDLSPRRVLITQILGRIWPGAYFSSLAPLRVQNVPRQPLPSTSWVRVRNRLAGICGSDLHLIYADGDFRIAPAAIPGRRSFYLGHEVVGEILEAGDGVQQLRVGDRVVLQYEHNCLSAGVQPLCRSCALGSYSLCERGVLPGPSPVGGGWSEEMLLHEQQLFLVPADMSDEQAVLLEPASVAVHAVLRCLPRTGDKVLIIGAGTIGLLLLQAIRALAPQTEVSVLARYPFQIEQATRMGAQHIIYPQDSYLGVQRATKAQLYNGPLGNRMLLGGYDVIYDAIGNQHTLHNALRWARANASVVLVGLSLRMMQIDLTPVWYQEVNLVGTLGHNIETWPLGSSERCSTFNVVAELMRKGQIHPEHLITHRFALNEYRHALLAVRDKAESRTIKVVFDYSLMPASVVPNVRASARRPALTAAANSQDADVDEVEAGAQPMIPSKTVEQEVPVQASLQTTPLPETSTVAQTPPMPALSDDVDDTNPALPAIEKQKTIIEAKEAPEEPQKVEITTNKPVEDELKETLPKPAEDELREILGGLTEDELQEILSEQAGDEFQEALGEVEEGKLVTDEPKAETSPEEIATTKDVAATLLHVEETFIVQQQARSRSRKRRRVPQA